jgi:hypothetical protein
MNHSVSVDVLTPAKPQRKTKMSGLRQMKERTRHIGIRRPTRFGKGLRLKRRHPLRLRMPVVLPAVLGHPTPRNEGRNEIEDLFQQACPDGFSRFSVAGFQGGCYRQWPPPYMPKWVPRIALPHWYRRVYDMLRPLVSLATEL